MLRSLAYRADLHGEGPLLDFLEFELNIKAYALDEIPAGEVTRIKEALESRAA